MLVMPSSQAIIGMLADLDLFDHYADTEVRGFLLDDVFHLEPRCAPDTFPRRYAFGELRDANVSLHESCCTTAMLFNLAPTRPLFDHATALWATYDALRSLRLDDAAVDYRHRIAALTKSLGGLGWAAGALPDVVTRLRRRAPRALEAFVEQHPGLAGSELARARDLFRDDVYPAIATYFCYETTRSNAPRFTRADPDPLFVAVGLWPATRSSTGDVWLVSLPGPVAGVIARCHATALVGDAVCADSGVVLETAMALWDAGSSSTRASLTDALCAARLLV